MPGGVPLRRLRRFMGHRRRLSVAPCLCQGRNGGRGGCRPRGWRGRRGRRLRDGLHAWGRRGRGIRDRGDGRRGRIRGFGGWPTPRIRVGGVDGRSRGGRIHCRRSGLCRGAYACLWIFGRWRDWRRVFVPRYLTAIVTKAATVLPDVPAQQLMSNRSDPVRSRRNVSNF